MVCWLQKELWTAVKLGGGFFPGLQKKLLFLKPNPVGFMGFWVLLFFWGLNPGFVKWPNLTGSGIFVGLQFF